MQQQDTEKGQKHLKEIPAYIDKVHFGGIRRTKEDVLKKIATGLFEAQNFHDAVLKAHDVRQQLENLNAFERIDIVLDTSQGPSATSEGLEVTFNVKEKEHIEVGAWKEFGSSNCLGVIWKVNLPNVFGKGENIYAQYKDGRMAVGFSVLPMKSLLGWTLPRINQNLFVFTTKFLNSSFKEKNKGLAVDIQFESFPQVHHTLMWEDIWRNACGFSGRTPFPIKEEAGHSVKSCLKHILTVDQRDNPNLPTHGSYFNLYQEYAGFEGNANFFKHEVQYQINKNIWRDFVLQGTVKGGLVHSPGRDSAVHTNDIFFLGEPLNFYGFEINRVGPLIGNSAFGAKAYWTSGLHLYTPLPFKPLRNRLDKVCRPHFFANAGSVGNFISTDDNCSALFSNLHWSCGAGLVFSLGGLVRLELNYCFPITNQPCDRIRTGLQFGIGVNS